MWLEGLLNVDLSATIPTNSLIYSIKDAFEIPPKELNTSGGLFGLNGESIANGTYTAVLDEPAPVTAGLSLMLARLSALGIASRKRSI